MAEPDFVLLGVRQPDGRHAVYASGDLDRADLVAHREMPIAQMLVDPHAVPPRRYDLTAELRTYEVGYGSSYGEALDDLLTRWQPPEGSFAATVTAPVSLVELPPAADEQRYELIDPTSECSSPLGHVAAEIRRAGDRIPVKVVCSYCGDSYDVVVLPREVIQKD